MAYSDKKKLKELLVNLDYEIIQGNEDSDITKLVYDSRKAIEGSLYICITGAVSDGHSYIQDVIDKGANAIIVEKDIKISDYKNCESTTFVKVDNTRYALAITSANYFKNPANKLKVIGITGTKGKTTTTYMIKTMLEMAGFKTGLIGTIETIIGDEHIPSKNTTPESYVIQETFAKMVDEKCDVVVMEVSSQGLKLDRVAGITFDYGMFSNLGVDHIGKNEHASFEEYLECKSKLFKNCKVGILNKDDEHYEDIIKGHSCEIETFGFDESADLYAKDVRLLRSPGHLGVEYNVCGLMDFDVSVNIPGKFSVYNSLMAIAICRHFGVDVKTIKKSMANLSVKGRVEIVPIKDDRYTMVIDYAHNAMSAQSIITTIKEYDPKRLVVLFGAGGNRDRNRRFEMGQICSELADFLILTNDNPRNEEPMSIINDIIIGVKKGDAQYVAIPDRKEAIRYAMENAQEGDVILLIGKGHEDYIEINGERIHFDEREAIAEVEVELAR